MENGPGGEGAPAAGATAVAGGAAERRAVRWERFLPRRSLRVLLVESDDCTRHIVAALLRKCSYDVAAVADGTKAWEVLKERRRDIDLVLTEISVPSISGIGLLSKIMGDEECKNIPVIMMSSHDSIGVVLKCMLKGAVDFLFKPIRKNELQNLWQHVWRKHCSSSSVNAYNTNVANNRISANADEKSKTDENNNEGTDTQSSSSKPVVEHESVQNHNKARLAEGRSYSRDVEEFEQLDSNIVKSASKLKMVESEATKLYDPEEMGLKETLASENVSVAERCHEENHSYNLSPHGRVDLDYARSREGHGGDPESHNRNIASNESVQDMINLMEPTTNKQFSSLPPKKNARKENTQLQEISSSGMPPLWELSLRRSQFNGCVQQESNERNILKHSSSSAFSRYGEKRIDSSCQNPISSASCIKTGESREKCHSHVRSHLTENANIGHLISKERISSSEGNVGEAAIDLHVSSESNKEDASVQSSVPSEDACDGHSSAGGNAAFRHPQYGFVSLPIPFQTTSYQNLYAGYGAILQPILYPETFLSPHSSAATEKATIQTPDQTVRNDKHLINHPRYIESNHHAKNLDHWRSSTDVEPCNQRDLSCCAKELTYHSGSCSQDVLKGSGSNGNGETTDAAAYAGNALESGNESGVQNCNRKGLGIDLSRREAALLKFRLKRKDRCFEKKVRYHSRKKLAEQQPRIKGQFVCQKIPNS